MERVEINICIRPYYHDVIDTIVRKPKFKKTTGKHYVSYKGKEYPLAGNKNNYVVWMDED